jgi:hypothetical protein
MTQEGCYGCINYLSNVKLAELNKNWEKNAHIVKIRQDPFLHPKVYGRTEDTNPFPLDVDWKNCSMGPDVWLNCDERKTKHIEPFDGLLTSITNKEVRWYKGKTEIEVLVKGKRKGKRGPITWLVRELRTGKEFVTIPRLCWRSPKDEI